LAVLCPKDEGKIEEFFLDFTSALVLDPPDFGVEGGDTEGPEIEALFDGEFSVLPDSASFSQ
jgi:hypothetical protein